MDSKKVLLKLLTFYIPSKALKKKVRKKLSKVYDIIRHNKVRFHYQIILVKLRKKFKTKEKSISFF